MKLSPIVSLLFTVAGCGSGTQPAEPAAESGGKQAQQQRVATSDNQDATPATKAPTEEPVAEKPVVAKPSAETPSTAETPDVATVKKAMTPD